MSLRYPKAESSPSTPSAATTPAELAVRALEALAPGSPDRPGLRRTAEHAVGAAVDAAIEVFAPALSCASVPVDAWLELAFHRDFFALSTTTSQLLDLFAAALVGENPGLAALIRTRGRQIVRGAALAVPAMAREYVRAQERAFAVGLAWHLRSAEPAAAADLMEVLPALEARLDAEEQRHQEHLERLTKNAEVARQAEAAAERQRQMAFFGARAARLFAVGTIGRTTDYTGEQIASFLQKDSTYKLPAILLETMNRETRKPAGA